MELLQIEDQMDKKWETTRRWEEAETLLSRS